MRIFHKLFLGFFAIVLLTWIVGIFSLKTFRDVREKAVAGYAASFSNMILESINRQIYSDFIAIKTCSLGNTLQRTLQESNKVFQEMADPEGYINRMDQEWIAAPGDKVTPFMEHILELPLSKSFQQEQIFYRERFGYLLFSELLVTNQFGAIAGASNKTTDYRQDDEDWWKEAWGKGFFFGPIEWDPSSETHALSIAARIENDHREPIGVFKGVLDFRDINEQLAQCEKKLIYKTGRLFLIDSNGHYLFPKEKFGKSIEPLLKDCLAKSYVPGGFDFERVKDEAGHDKFIVLERSLGYEEYSGGGWVLIASYDEHEIFEPNRKAEIFVFIVLGISTVLSILVGLLLALSFSRPLEKLRRAAGRFGVSDFEAKVGIVSRDEFGEVARRFETMAENLRKKTTSIESLNREIEDRKLLEMVSLENALFLQKLMDSIPMPLSYKDISGAYIGCNSAFEVFFGVTKKQVVGKKGEEFFGPELTKTNQERDSELLAVPGIQVYEASVRNGDDECRSIVFYKATFVGPSLKIQGIIEVMVDVTLRQHAEEMFEESEKRFMDVLYAAQDAILLIDGEIFVDCNEATARMLGYSNRAEFLMRHPSDLSPSFQPDGRNSFEKANEMMKIAFERGFNRFEWIHKKANGEDFPVEVSLTPVVVHGKNIIHCLWRDLTELKKIENQVRQLSQAMEQSPSCVMITDVDGKIEYVNQRFVDFTGYSAAEVLGQNPRILKSGEQSLDFYKDLWDTVIHGQDWQGQFCNKKKNGELYWELAHIAPLRNEKKEITHFVAVKEDITYRRQIEEQLRHSLRMEAVGRLAGGIAHDFNNMLTVINGYSGYLVGKMKPEDPHYDKVREIRDAGDCAATIVRQLLNLSRRESPKPQLIKVADATKKMKHMINRLIGSEIELQLNHLGGESCVKIDPGQLEQVLLNLLVNAREAMPGGGVLTVTTDVVRMEEVQEELRPPGKKTGDFVRITVEDKGAGIDPALKTRIFEPFFTTKKRGMNTGLGLSIVYGIVEQAGGAISLESQVGKGTTFRVYLPKAQEALGGEEARILEELPPGQGKILLVEDERQVREFALQVLRERGYDVRVARGGEEALTMFSEDPGRPFDLLLTDLTMPKMNGKELVSRVRKKVPEGIKVIFMSGYSDQSVSDVQDASFLQKPFSHRALSMKVFEVLGR